MYAAAKTYTSKADWEFLLIAVLQALNPRWRINRTGGRSEVEHGTDILATIPDVFGDGNYGVAIQVKDYKGVVGPGPLDQIRKATVYWKDRDIKILERVLVLVNCEKEGNEGIDAFAAKDPVVRLIWTSDLLKLVSRAAFQLMSDADFALDAASGLS